MSPRNLDAEVQRKGRRVDEFEVNADPADTPVLRECLRDWLRGNKWGPDEKPADIKVRCWAPEVAEVEFLHRFYELTGQI